MMRSIAAAAVLIIAVPGVVQAERLALLNYENKPGDTLESLRMQSAPGATRQGIAIVELDPESEDYGRILLDMPFPGDSALHHIFYNKDQSKAYVTSLSQEQMYVIDMTHFPYRAKAIATPGCAVQEDIVFSDDNSRWFVTCMGSGNVVVGDAIADVATGMIELPGSYPHGIGLHEGIDRMLVTDCLAPDMSDVGNAIEVIEVSTGAVLGSIETSVKSSAAAPIEVLFVPHSDPPVAYITNAMAATLAAAVWNPASQDFEVSEIFDFEAVDANMPLEIYVNRAVDRLYVTTALPGAFHIFDISGGLLAPKQIAQIPAAGGAHHVAFTPDERIAYVQNSLLNLPLMSDGSITVIDLEAGVVLGNLDTFTSQSLNPNSITAMPDWYHQAGHFNNGPGE
jgi:DNA-binding beta-propeller fold protein YncE